MHTHKCTRTVNLTLLWKEMLKIPEFSDNLTPMFCVRSLKNCFSVYIKIFFPCLLCLSDHSLLKSVPASLKHELEGSSSGLNSLLWPGK